MKAKKNSKTAKETKPKQERQPHPFGEPPDRAKGYNFPSGNPLLFTYANKSTNHLPQNLQDVFATVEKHKDGIALKDLKVTGLGKKTLAWLCRQLAKHEFLRVKAEEKPAPKTKKIEEKPKAKAAVAG